MENVITLTAEQFKDIIYGNINRERDKRFRSYDEGGVFKYLYLEHSLLNWRVKQEDLLFPAVMINKKIVALAELQRSPSDSNLFWISFVCTDKQYEGKGYARLLIKEIFNQARKLGITIQNSSYSEEGAVKLKALFQKEAKESGVEFLESELNYI